jgi:TrmH family RNA methyltransferase
VQISKAELKYLASFSQKKVRSEEQKFLLEGWRALKEVINSSHKIEMVAVVPRYLEDPDYGKILAQLKERRTPVKEINPSDLKKVADTVHSQGVLALVHQRRFSLDDEFLRKARLMVAADAVNDPGNLGSILRSADWFGVDAVLLAKGCVEFHNEKVVRTTVGSMFHLPVVEDLDLPEALAVMRESGFAIVALAGDGEKIYTELGVQGKMVFVVGNEAHGVSVDVRRVADVVVKIPRVGKAESLNVGVACGIMLAYVRAKTEEREGR